MFTKLRNLLPFIGALLSMAADVVKGLLADDAKTFAQHRDRKTKPDARGTGKGRRRTPARPRPRHH